MISNFFGKVNRGDIVFFLRMYYNGIVRVSAIIDGKLPFGNNLYFFNVASKAYAGRFPASKGCRTTLKKYKLLPKRVPVCAN